MHKKEDNSMASTKIWTGDRQCCWVMSRQAQKSQPEEEKAEIKRRKAKLLDT